MSQPTGPTHRVLRLLSLLQSRTSWSGSELAERLGVTTRTVRRDVGRLRDLGYPVSAGQGVAGGYRLGAGRALPPLLLDDDEAVAVAVSLRLAAGGSVAGASEAAVRTLAKLDQVLPPRLRAEVHAIHGATATIPGGGSEVDGEAMLVLARACRDRIRVRFGYTSGSGAASERTVEPVRLVATQRRWYLMAWDVDRQGWRTFRLDRASEVATTTWRFPVRDHPDPVDFVQRAVVAAPYRYVARVLVHAPESDVRDRVSPLAGAVAAIDAQSCWLTAGGDNLAWLACHLLLLGFEFGVVEPAELRESMTSLGSRFLAAGRVGRSPGSAGRQS
ncbi:MAG TPA: YafY family protein [Dermatophilaceae bacterium]|nr:YafY family protein [Dermatophilaceae bacterium]